ncbi:MAG: ABC transporter ATP-binding protein [Pseudomonadota bacterium]
MAFKFLSRKSWIEFATKSLDKVKSEDFELFLRIFNEYFHKFKLKYILIFVLIGIAAVATVAPVFILESIVDAVFIEQKTSYILPIFLVTITLFMVKGFSIYFQTVLSSQIANSMVSDIQRRMFAHMLSQRTDFYARHSSDNLLMRFNQGATGFKSVLTTVLVNGTREFFTLIGFFATMLYYDALLTMISLVVAPAVFLVINVILRKIKDVSKLELAGIADLNKNVRETVQGITVVKSFNLETPLQENMNGVISGIETRRNKIAQYQAAPVPLLDMVGGIAVGLTFLYAGYQTTSGAYSPAVFIAFIGALLLASDSARKLSQIPVKLKTAFVSVSLVFSFLNIDETEKSGSQTLNLDDNASAHKLNGSGPLPIIQFSNVDFGYDEKTSVLNEFSLDIQKGDMVALVGPSGAGKSTVLKLLLKLYEPQSGTICINGQNQSDLALQSLREAISFVGQSNFIFQGTIKDNLTFKHETIDQALIAEACKAVGMHEFIQTLPKQYETDVGELGALISGGQAQRLNIARAIIKDAPILLLDEVTSALDAENEQLIKSYVQSQIGKKTIIAIAHRLSTIKDATQIALMDEGKVVDLAPHEQLLVENEYYQKIVNLQFLS